MYEHIHIYMHMYVYSCICIIKYHYYWYYCHYSMYPHCLYFCYCCYHILYHVSYLHIRGQISGNSLERTSTLLVCIRTKSVKSQRLQALSASMKAAFFPRIPVPWPSESCSIMAMINIDGYVKVDRRSLRTQLSISLKASMENCQARSCSKWTTRNADRHCNCLIWIQDLGDRWNLADSCTIKHSLRTFAHPDITYWKASSSGIISRSCTPQAWKK